MKLQSMLVGTLHKVIKEFQTRSVKGKSKGCTYVVAVQQTCIDPMRFREKVARLPGN